MADTILTKDQLLVAFADNNARAITAQTHRDAVMSYMSCTGQLSGAVGPTALTTTPAFVTFSSSGGISGGIIDDPAWTYLDIGAGADGIYLFGGSLTVEATSNNTYIGVGVFLNGALVVSSASQRLQSGDRAAVTFTTLTNQRIVGDRFQLGVALTQGNSTTVIYHGGYMWLARIASTNI